MISLQKPLLPRSDRPALWVGIDPGQTGALALLNERGRLLLAVTWVLRVGRKSRPDGFEVSSYNAMSHNLTQLFVEPEFWALGDTLGDRVHLTSHSVPVSLCVEELFVGPNPKGSLTLAHDTGRMVGGVQSVLHVGFSEVLATVWRCQVLHSTANTWSTETAKEQALKLMPARVVGLQGALKVLGKPHHLAEAAGIACWDRATWNSRQGRKRRKG
ncbi:MAG: hypothetical protein AAFV53_00335 [Myxococcota bacterium]